MKPEWDAQIREIAAYVGLERHPRIAQAVDLPGEFIASWWRRGIKRTAQTPFVAGMGHTPDEALEACYHALGYKYRKAGENKGI